MQFIKNGPDVPDRLLQAHEDGQVVFFCGAGISYPARLPGFRDLVTALFERCGEPPWPIAQTAIKKGQYDTAIGLLEERIRGDRFAVREQLAAILTPDLTAPGATATHDALLTLARSRKGSLRIVTTNFDRLFEEAATQRGLTLRTFEAPLLPIPKNRWDGLVYLHGLLSANLTEDDLNRLVASSGDFGLAYLTERWAARFVSELFRNYTVCFVGYSIDDPVLRYMMDALAADQSLGESRIEAFAVGSHSKGKRNEKLNEWGAKHVTPILYPEHRRHAYLHRTLCEWAATYRDGTSGKESIVVRYASNPPMHSTEQDDYVGRVLWALSDKSSGLPAKRFAELNPPPSLEWLEPLTQERFQHHDLSRFGVSPDNEEDAKPVFSLLRRPTPYKRAPWMELVHRGHQTETQWDVVMHQLARWLTRHLDNPNLILWVAKEGGRLHGRFAFLIANALEQTPPRPRMQKLWRLVLSGRLANDLPRYDLYDWGEQLKHAGNVSAALRIQLRELLTPRVRIRRPIPGWDGDDDGGADESSRIKDLVDWEVVLSTSHVHLALKEAAHDANWREGLPEFLSDATMLLRDALDLMRELEGADDRQDSSYLYQPSIGEHLQNRTYRDWTALIDLARDAWLACAAKAPVRARLEVERWLTISYPLFRRLAFFAATDSTLFPPHQALGWLLVDDRWWLWSVETEREALRLLVAIAPQLAKQDRETLERAILEGPPRSMFRDDIDPQRLRRTFDREIWLRLAKCSAAGVELGDEAADGLEVLSQQYPKWRVAEDERDEFPIWMGSDEDWREFLQTPETSREVVDWLRRHPVRDPEKPDDWRERCKRDFRRTLAALIHLASRGEWIVERWREALQAWADEPLAARSWRYVGRLLAIAQDDVIEKVAPALGGWLQALAKTFQGDEEAFLSLIRRVIAVYHDRAVESSDDPLHAAINHPIGHVTRAALSWWYRQPLKDDQGLPDVLTSLFTELCDPQISSLRHGRVLLAGHVIALFRVDREWATQRLLPLFDWGSSVEEARAAWGGFLWSPRVYPPLMERLKPQFLATAPHYEHLGEHAEQYVAFLTLVALEPGDLFTRAELAAATRSLPVDGLENAAHTLVRASEATAQQQRADNWRNRVAPYLKFVWPQSRDMSTAAISESFARLCIAADDAFPEARHQVRFSLQPLDHPNFIVNLVHEAKLCERFPEDSLAYLDAVVGNKPQLPPRDLKHCLEGILELRPDLEEDDGFRRLRDYLREYGGT